MTQKINTRKQDKLWKTIINKNTWKTYKQSWEDGTDVHGT